MIARPLQRWLDAWGYSEAPEALHVSVSGVPADHVYRREIEDLLDPEGAIRARAVFSVDGVPAICFLTADGRHDDQAAFLAIRERIWNQNLVSIVLTVDDDQAMALPVLSPKLAGVKLAFADASTASEFSRADVQSGQVFVRRPDWFSPEDRVDRVLLANLQVMVQELVKHGLSKTEAQLLMAQVMFVSYLEQRDIVGDRYRKEHQLETLLTLTGKGDRQGVGALLAHLKDDFNGDLLPHEPESTDFWKKLPSKAFSQLHDFLRRMVLENQQHDFWTYDFRFIPVELISGIYESFLADDKKVVGAYYTPRHLAMLVVDLVLVGSTDPTQERIYDGACGSGILLTTAFRRLLTLQEAKRGEQLPFGDRVKLLTKTIFGSDLNESACKVTAFSLYLAVLEGLKPADIWVLTRGGKSKLPKLTGKNLYGGETGGDFFSGDNPLASTPQFTVFLSNPPWVEPSKSVELASDRWAHKEGVKIPRRNTAGAFLLRATECVQPEGTLCFILPVSLLAAHTSRAFVREVLERYEILSLINFGDLRKLLFAAARQPCIVLIARPRPPGQSAPTPTETIQYWVPKADISFAFGRLTLHGSDRHVVRAQSLAHSNELLTTLFWGGPSDVALLATLRAPGTLGDFLDATEGWNDPKGFHALDNSIEDPVSSKPLWKAPYLDARAFVMDGPLLDNAVLKPFPKSAIREVSRLSHDVMSAFTGPRIVFKDGMSTDRGVCAAYTSAPCSFKHSVAAIIAPVGQEDLLRFLALYLQSDMVRYALLLTAFQVAFERERVTKRDITGLAFLPPDQHANPTRAWAIVREVSKQLKKIERASALTRAHQYDQWKPEAQALIAEYFGLSSAQSARINEVVELVLDSVQPNAIASLYTPLQHRPTQAMVQTYAKTLVNELGLWRDAMQGEGRIQASLILSERSAHGPLGILRLTPTAAAGPNLAVNVDQSDAAVQALIATLQREQLIPAQASENLYLASDVVIRNGNTLYLVKPLLRRFWMVGEALRDAERIVRATQASHH
ncbi:SAM-dependent methyltransferase [Xanthomonas translucens pv. graminis]|uniref:HsdM family class I SAM-dependent methyltransferase n=1 Tax=Xanthomonas graminis TaxID=3390026 RepID=UPI002540E97D|nr:N-6 DNA methylase [Xanthomonas translucens]WIH05134.1 SAM-dependent methyltransferase [Xanthomonas translucens pv. graminis]